MARRSTLVVTICALVCTIGCRGNPDRAGTAPGGTRAGSGAPAAGAASEPIAWPAIDEAALVALQTTERFELGTPVPLAILPDGAVVFRRSRPRDRVADLYQLDATGKTALLASAAALVARAPAGGGAGPSGAAGGTAPPDLGAGIASISVSDDGSRLLVPLAGRLFLVERTTGAAREIAGASAPPEDATLSPDGKRVAFASGGDLWVQTIGEARPVRIAQHPADAAPGAATYATPDDIARAFGRDRGYWWSPDSQAIAFERRDAHAVPPRRGVDPRPAAPEPRVPLAGQPLATVDLGIVSVRGGAPRWVTWETARYPYLARVIWPAHGLLSLVVVGREQTQAAVVAVDPRSGATRTLLVDKDPVWLELAPEPLTWLPDGAGFLWMTESTGAWSLEHHAADGRHLATVATADVGVRRVVAVAPDGRDVVVEGAADPREQAVWRIALAGGPPVALTPAGGVHTARAAHGVVVTSSLLAGGGLATTVLRADGSRSELPSLAERPAAVPTTRIDTITLDDHAQLAAVTRPHAFDPTVRYPVVLRLGAALETKSVLDALDSYVLDQWYADAGFIVVRTDARGTAGKDRLWRRAIAGDVLTIPMNDQIAAVKRLGARYPELDLGRVAVLGAEAGGFLAAMAVLTHPTVFAAAAAVSPITDWALVDAATSERILKTPAQNPEGYRRATAAPYAEQLSRPLLLVPSVPGSRIAIAHSFALIDALSAAGKRAEIATLPDQPDAARRIAATRLVLDFFRQKLGPPVRPAAMPAPRDDDDDEEQEQREREQRRGTPAAPRPSR